MKDIWMEGSIDREIDKQVYSYYQQIDRQIEIKTDEQIWDDIEVQPKKKQENEKLKVLKYMEIAKCVEI